MSRSGDSGHFFQTDASESTRARKTAKAGNKHGNPIVLQSKILSVVKDPSSSTCVYISESAGCVRNVDVKERKTKAIYRGPTAPVTSVAIGGGDGGLTVFAGCWDKDVWSWKTESKVAIRRFKGHSDFVTAVVCARVANKQCLISGGADAKIIIWDTGSGQKLHTLRDTSDSMMTIQDLVIDPEDSTATATVIVSSSSDPHVRRWSVGLSAASQILSGSNQAIDSLGTQKDIISEHDTSVYKLLFAGDDQEYDLWTASADGTAKCLSRGKAWAAEETYEHGDYVRAIAVSEHWIITAGRSEDVKIWDRATGNLWHVYEGHYEEVTGLLLLDGGKEVVSVSLDGTVRTWSLEKSRIERARVNTKEDVMSTVKEDKQDQLESHITADEEAELAELMDDNDG